jgi:copper chaperone
LLKKWRQGQRLQVALEPASTSGRMAADPGGALRMISLSIPDMSCGHCKATVMTALASVPGVASVTIDLDRRTAMVEGDAGVSGLLKALETAGYPAVPA